MHRLWRHRPSPAMIVACVALVFSLGGISYAAITLPAASVGTKQLKNNAVVGAKVKNGSLSVADISSTSLSQLSRVASVTNSATLQAARETAATVSLTVPRAGFVLVQGWVAARNANGEWGVQIRDDVADTYSKWINLVTGSGTYSTSGNTAVFPATRGEHTYSVIIRFNNTINRFTYYSSATALFIPYNGQGSSTPPPTAASPSNAATQDGAPD